MLQKNFPVLLWGPIFVGAPVRPNMLNMPKSASGRTVYCTLKTKTTLMDRRTQIHVSRFHTPILRCILLSGFRFCFN